MEKPLLQLKDLCKYYTSGQSVVMGLSNIDLSFRRGEFVAITGESGSGKSTLSHVIGGIIPFESGELTFRGKPTSHYDSVDWEHYRRDHISFISQNYGILPGASVLGNVVTALRLSGMDKKEAKIAAKEILQQVELWELRRRRAAKLSSGQKQRLSIARALAKPAPILIADEPTGNLDPENSKKVIDLLANAAKDRLVILVTHEFSEAEDVATRHIMLQDGKVVMDAALRDAAEPGPIPAPAKKSTAPISPFVARLQQTSRPVWSTLMTLFFTLTAFSVFAFLGAFIIALDDTDTRIYDTSAFANGKQERIIVTTLDQRPLTQEDYDQILQLPYVVQLEPNGYFTDAQYAYRDGVDYKTVHSEQVTPDLEHYVTVSYHPGTNAPFMQGIPMLPGGEFPLLEGRLPESFYEVVAHSQDHLDIGQRVSVFLVNKKYWGYYQYVRLEFTVVGVTDYGEGLYFHNDVGRFCQHISRTRNGVGFGLFLPEDKVNTDNEYQKFLDRLGDNAVYVPEDYSPYLTDTQMRAHPHAHTEGRNPWTGEVRTSTLFANINAESPQDPHAEVRLDYPADLVIGTTPPDGPYTFENDAIHVGDVRVVEVSQNTFDILCWQANSEQISLTIQDYAYTDRVVESLEKLGYIATSPFQQGSTRVDAEKAEARKQTLSVCIAALLAIVALQVVLLRALFSVQTESYKLMSHIGLVSRSARLSVLWQILSFTLLGQLLGYGGIRLCGFLGVERIAHVLKYLPGKYIALLSAVHLVTSLAAALWVMWALKKQVYPLAGKYSDINLDSYEEAAV